MWGQTVTSILDQTSHFHRQRNHRDLVLRDLVHSEEFPLTVAPMVELGLTVPSRPLQHQLLLRQDHVPSEDLLLTAALMEGLDQIVMFQVDLPKDHL